MAARRCGLWLGILVLGSFLPAVLVKFGADAVIIKGPENITAPIGAIATFHCLAQGDDAFWEINDTTIQYPEDQAPFIQKGFMFSEAINYDPFNFTITVNALPGNNNTRIMCLVYPLDDNNFPGSLTVIVPQPPPSPKPQLLVLNATTIQFSWLPPFAWAEYPIVNYSVQVHNRATGEVLNVFINATSEIVSTTAPPVTFTYNTPQGEVMQNCEELVFIVSAASTIGWGSPAIVTGGFPIVPRLETNSTFIKSTVTFQFDGTPLLLLNIQLPEICSFQELSYSIIIQHTLNNVSDAGGADDIIVIGPKTVMGCTNVYEVINSGLVEDAVYSVFVQFDTLAGNISSTTTFTTATSFNTVTPSLCPCSSEGEHSQPTTDYPDITAGAGRHSQSTTKTVSTNITATGAAGISLVEKVVMGVSISLVIIIVSGIMLLLVCGFIYLRRTSGESAEKACGDKVIYEECESIQPELKSLTPPHPTADVMEPHYIDSPTNQAKPSQIAKGSKKETALAVASGPTERSGDENKARWAISEPDSKDKYIVMNPVGTLTSSLLGGWDDPHSELPKQEQF